MQNNSYVLISACRNESAYVEKLIDAIAAQKVRPLRWVIVDDGSTDDTYERAIARSAQFPFIEVAKMPGGRARSFSSQVYAAMYGSERVKDLPYGFLGFLDADILVEPDYYERLLGLMASDPQLGICGGAVIDQFKDRVVDTRKGSEDYHVAGGVQFFRRQCFEQIGGHHPIQGGGQDTIADIMAMMHGWKIRVFPELPALHLRPDGFANDSVIKRGRNWGRKFYLIGYHPLYYCAQCVRRIGQRPFLVASFCQLIGFIMANLKGESRPVSPEFVQFLRNLQMQRLKKACFGRQKA
ncbi:MAG TPA: glycosyltransferase family A protein [Lacunisphaera sp.]|jgi:glycosyltransferase involved in cell wall biosynthesis